VAALKTQEKTFHVEGRGKITEVGLESVLSRIERKRTCSLREESNKNKGSPGEPGGKKGPIK